MERLLTRSERNRQVLHLLRKNPKAGETIPKRGPDTSHTQ
jgi:hypothetical protein